MYVNVYMYAYVYVYQYPTGVPSCFGCFRSDNTPDILLGVWICMLMYYIPYSYLFLPSQTRYYWSRRQANMFYNWLSYTPEQLWKVLGVSHQIPTFFFCLFILNCICPAYSIKLFYVLIHPWLSTGLLKTFASYATRPQLSTELSFAW